MKFVELKERVGTGITRMGAALAMTVKIVFFTAILFSTSTFAAGPDLSRYTAYLNNIKTLEAVFFERNNRGGTASGKLYVYRPGPESSETFGRLRLSYDPPRELEIVADGESLLHYDRKDDDLNSVSLESTPLAFLLRPVVSFSKEMTVRRIQREGGVVRITVCQTEEPDAGTLTLIFIDNPLELKQWMVTDAQGVQTLVTLDQVKINTPLPTSLFQLQRLR